MQHPQIISPDAFCERMRARWTSELGNVYTPWLGLQWMEFANVYNAHIAAHDDATARERYTVIAAALGAGKTQGTIVYCSMLAEKYSDEEQPGVLIVTRRIEDAEEMAATINRLSGREKFAVAFHSEISARTLKLSDLADYPVVVVTHRGYQIALDQLAQTEVVSRWPDFSRYRDGQRKLNVIDEAIDLVEHDNVTIDALKRVLYVLLPENLLREHPEERALLEETLEHLRSPEAFKIPDGRRAKLYEALKQGNAPDLSELQAKVRLTVFRPVRSWNRRRVVMSSEDAKQEVIDVLRAVGRVYRQWAYVAKLPTGEQILHTARLILPRNTKGAVILDATAKANALYRLFGDRVEIRSMQFHTRNYKNVRFHVSRGHRTGKDYIIKEADNAAPEIVANLARHLDATRKALIVTHQDAEPSFAQYETAFQRHTAHWGAIDGSNEWRDCDAVCIVSLPRRPDDWATSSYFAITGDVRDEFLGDEGDPIREEIRTGQVVADVAQAIGRTRCRKVVDVNGNCAPVDVFLFLPDTVEGDAITDGLKEHFTDALWTSFDYSGAVTKVRPRRSRVEEGLLLALKALPRGHTSAGQIRAALGCSPKRWEKLAADLKDTRSKLSVSLSGLGVAFLPGARGRGYEAAFVKA